LCGESGQLTSLHGGQPVPLHGRGPGRREVLRAGLEESRERAALVGLGRIGTRWPAVPLEILRELEDGQRVTQECQEGALDDRRMTLHLSGPVIEHVIECMPGVRR
jgi:hypothetical protein